MTANCSDCPYCEPTNDFFRCWCSYWNKFTYITNSCDISEQEDNEYDDLF